MHSTPPPHTHPATHHTHPAIHHTHLAHGAQGLAEEVVVQLLKPSAREGLGQVHALGQALNLHAHLLRGVGGWGVGGGGGRMGGWVGWAGGWVGGVMWM